MASPLQVADAGQQRVGRRPQTTEPVVGGGPFLRHTRESRATGYVTSTSFGGTINLPLKAVPGYLRYLDIRVTASGGSKGSASVVAEPDAPWNIFLNVLFKDAFGQTIIQCGGYSLYLINLFSGQGGFWNAQDPTALPSFTAVDANGNFNFRIRLPLELFDGFCSLAGANQSAVPSLTLTLAGSSAIYTTPPDTLPDTIEVSVQEAYYAVPLDDPALAPPDNGSSHQWSEQPIASSVGSGASNFLALPQLGSYVTSLIFVARDSNNDRSDSILPAATAGLQWNVDGVPVFIEEVGTREDLMFQLFGVTRPAGVIVYTFRDSVANFGPVSAVDTGDLFLPTNPGSLLEWGSSAWGTNNNAPAQITVVSGRVYAAGGIPYTHLAD